MFSDLQAQFRLAHSGGAEDDKKGFHITKQRLVDVLQNVRDLSYSSDEAQIS